MSVQSCHQCHAKCTLLVELVIALCKHKPLKLREYLSCRGMLSLADGCREHIAQLHKIPLFFSHADNLQTVLTQEKKDETLYCYCLALVPSSFIKKLKIHVKRKAECYVLFTSQVALELNVFCTPVMKLNIQLGDCLTESSQQTQPMKCYKDIPHMIDVELNIDRWMPERGLFDDR